MLMFVKSTDCVDLFPSNSPNRFFIKLPEVINFNSNQVMHVLDLRLPEFEHANITNIYLITNFVSQVYVGCKKIPVVQRYFIESEYPKGFQLDYQSAETNVKEINTDIIEIGILNGESLEYVEFKEGITYCGFQIV
jgi:hypothetical protein